MEFKDYYKILGVDPSASSKDIKTAYRKLARKYHPDVSEQHNAEDQFKEITEAYEVLKIPEKRSEYDEIRQYGVHGQSFKPPPGWQPSGSSESRYYSTQNHDFSDFFSSIFGQAFEQSNFDYGHTSQQQYSSQKQRPQQRGQDIETDMPIFLEDTLREESKTISYRLGHVEKTLNVKIPMGVNHGERIRLKGQGKPGSAGAPNGDLYLRIILVPHPLFDVEGHNLIITLPISPWEAALGTKVELPTLAGKIHLTVPSNSQSGQRLRIKNKGLAKKDGGFGNLYAVLKIVMPPNCDKITKEHWQQIAELAAFDPRAEWRNI